MDLLVPPVNKIGLVYKNISFENTDCIDDPLCSSCRVQGCSFMSHINFAVVHWQTEHFLNPSEDNRQAAAPVNLALIVLCQPCQQSWKKCSIMYHFNLSILIFTHQGWFPSWVVTTSGPEPNQLLKPELVSLGWVLISKEGGKKHLKVGNSFPHCHIQWTHQWPPLFEHFLKC